jgi:hypothetical protein
MRADDRLVTVISRWLARHVSDEELRQELEGFGRGQLAPEQAEAVDELCAELKHRRRERAELERVARETLEALALGG